MASFIGRARKLAAVLRLKDWRHALLTHWVAAGTEHAVVLRQLGELGLIVDIGANRGQFALAVRQCCPDAFIVSFEPLLVPANKYRLVFAKDDRAVLHGVAIGPESGQTQIHLSARDDSSSLLPISEVQSGLFPGTQEIDTAVIRVAPLTEFIAPADVRNPALLKLDVQGFELQALIGSESLLPRFDWVYVECSFVELYRGQALADEVIAWLREHGFVLAGVYNMATDKSGKAIQADFLFSKR